jgi:hypothetical protein
MMRVPDFGFWALGKIKLSVTIVQGLPRVSVSEYKIYQFLPGIIQ